MSDLLWVTACRFGEALRAANPYAALGLSLAEAVAAGAGKKAVEARDVITFMSLRYVIGSLGHVKQ